MDSSTAAPRIAVILPCFNEEASVASTVRGFREALPSAKIYVYDNRSTDRTAAVAREAGAEVRSESRRGKGNVVRRAFADLDADVFVIADGDGTYDAAVAPTMVGLLLQERLDMVIGIRRHDEAEAYRAGHVIGNWMFNRVVTSMFGKGLSDIFSGYRVMSRRLVKSFPAMSEGFEIEAELSIHALQLRMPMREVETRYAKRQGSQSKLRTYRDGALILGHIVRLRRLLRPRSFYGAMGVVLGVGALLVGVPVVMTFFQTGQVPRFPSAILATGMVLLGSLLWLVGVILESTSQLAAEVRRLAYLSIPSARPEAD
jgi:glycosyltransferase involved in cell wall biosynthesis